ncbi:glycosyltransferase family 4 protein [bacterium]|nr:glycosyltransferase family 4 protein [bacterium]
MKTKKIKIAVDLDGVLADKPPLIPKKLIEWLYRGSFSRQPHYRLPVWWGEIWIRKFSHLWFFRPPIKKNLLLVKKLLKNKKLEVFIISGRFQFLKERTRQWFQHHFPEFPAEKVFINEKNIQPYLFKKQMVKELQIQQLFDDDPFVIKHLKQKAFLVSKKNNRPLKKLLGEENKKILFLLTYYYPHWTGLTAYAQRIAEGLAKRGWQVTVLTIKHKKSLKTQETYQGVKIIRLSPLCKISRSLITPGLLPALFRLRNRYQVVSIHLPFSDVLPATLFLKLLRKKVYLTHNGDLVLPQGFLNRCLEKIYYQTTYWAGKIANGIVAQTKDYAQHSPLLSSLKEKITFIYAPVIIPPPQRKKILLWKKRLGVKNNLLIGFAGRFVEEKGFDYLLKSIPLVRKKYPQAKFVFAGKRNIDYENFYQKNLPLIKKQKPHLLFLGLIKSRQKMANFYRMLDVFVISSRSDCFPSAQIEAVLCGTPVVCTNIPGAREVVRKTHAGVLVKPHSPQALARGIIKILRHPAPFRKATQKAKEVFNYEKSISQYEKLFQDN